MKYIFDFDDVIFRTTKHRLEYLFPMLEKAGVPRQKIEEYYKKTRLEGFSLRDAISHLVTDPTLDKEKLHDSIMQTGKNYVNSEMIGFIRHLGKENCFLITHGVAEFQRNKMRLADVVSLFSEIIILVGSKKNPVEKICERFENETVVFIDDKPQYFEDLDYMRYPNLKTILYKWQSAKELQNEINALGR